MKEYKIDLSMYDGKVREVVSEAVQTKAFALGYRWIISGNEIRHLQSTCLYFEQNGQLLYDGAIDAFESNQNPEISAADFLALTPESVKDAPEFKPFDKVLVRDDDGDKWVIDLFASFSADAPYSFQCLNYGWKQCIPYEGNEHLLGTIEDAATSID